MGNHRKSGGSLRTPVLGGFRRAVGGAAVVWSGDGGRVPAAVVLASQRNADAVATGSWSVTGDGGTNA